jgi:hypothetical protein
MKFFDENSEHFPGVVDIIDAMGLRHILSFSYDWSEEAILQFYASCHFDTNEERTLTWTIEGTRCVLTFEEFAGLLSIPNTGNLHRIHDMSSTGDSMTGASLAPLRRPNAVVTVDNVQSTSLLEPVYVMMHKIITKTLVPKIGDREKVRNFAIDLLVRMHTHGNERFDLADFLYQQIRLASYGQDRSFPYAPYIQVLIDARYPPKLKKECKHKVWTPRTDGTITLPRTSKKKVVARGPSSVPSKFEKFMAKTQRMIFGMCKANADDIAKMKSVHREKMNNYKAQVRQLGGQASDDEVVESSGTTSYNFPIKGYEEFFDDDLDDEDGGAASE